MTRVIEIRAREQLAAHFGRDRALHVYELGDLDPEFWPRTRWYTRAEAPGEAVALVYEGGDPPTLLLLGRAGDPGLRALLLALAPSLPDRVYAHLAPDIAEVLPADWLRHSHGVHLKLALADDAEARASLELAAEAPSAGWTCAPVDPDLGAEGLAELRAFYAEAYPDNWFDPAMLATGQYLVARREADGGEGEIVGVAGVHVHAPSQRVAALGNIAVAPSWRGRGLARGLSARLCSRLFAALGPGACLGLNVHADNLPARRCYASLGFSTAGRYEEVLLERR